MERKTSRKPAWLKWLVRLALGVGIVALLLSRSNVSDFVNVLRDVPLWVPFLSVLFYWAAQCLSAERWRLLIRQRSANFSFVDCMQLYLLGMFCNLFLPTAIGGDGVRAIVAGRRAGGVAQAASSILVERLTGFAALLVIGAVGVALWGQSSELGAQALPRVGSVLLLAACAFLALRALAYRLEKTATGRAATIAGKWAMLHHEIDFYARRERWGTLVAALTLSFVFQISLVGINVFLARAVGLSSPFTTFLWLVPLLSITSMLPIGIGGLGVREVAAVAVLGNSPNVVAWSLLYQATVWLASLPGALFLKEIKGEEKET
jgi:glycosyltransferase 2 family protein